MTSVLAVEASRTQALALTMDLESAGYHVLLARDGAEALRQLEAHQVDVIVSDVVMPGMDGYELCRAVKSDPGTREIPVILLTPLTDPLDVVNGLESGADNFLRKPYQPAQLVARIAAVLRNRELRDGGGVEQGIRLSFLDREFEINAERSQVLDLLVSTFEGLVTTSREVLAREEQLIRAHAEVRQQLHAVDIERHRLQAVVDAVPVPLFVLTAEGLVSHASEATAQTFGTTVEHLRGHRLDDVVSFVDGEGAPIPAETLPHHRAHEAGTVVSAGAAFDVYLSRADGSRVPVVLEASPILDDRRQGGGCVGTAHVLGALSQHDSVTGLPNGAAYLDHAAALLAAPKGDAALLLLELDRFDVTRADLGNAVGNEVLVEIARRLRQIFEPTRGSASKSQCFLAYLGSNQFGVVLGRLPGSFSVMHLAEAARRAVAEPVLGKRRLRLTASVGVALADDSRAGTQLFAAATLALRRARRRGGDHVELFGHDASQEVMDRLQLEVDLRSAVERDQIEVHFQPEVDLDTGELIGFEALARWCHERHGAVPPDVFITLAEESGIIGALGRQVLRKACVEASRWHAHGGRELSVAVNVSALQLRHDFVEEVMTVLTDTGLDCGRLLLEVTETAAMSDPDSTLPLLQKLRDQGVRVALDDFGTGHSSMAILASVEFDQLKLDRGFTSALLAGGRNAAIARSIVSLGHTLSVPVLAEGIETAQQRQLLSDLGCPQGQGYLFARPMSADAVEQYLLGTGDRACGER